MAYAAFHRLFSISILSIAGIGILSLHAITVKTDVPSVHADTTQCEDGEDNDGDQLIDYPNDPECDSPFDDKESTGSAPLRLSITDQKVYAQRGEALTYTIAVRNPADEEQTYDLRFHIPTDTDVEFVGGENHSATRQSVLWEDQKIGPGGAREYIVTLRIDHEAENYFTIHARVSAGASNATDTTTIYTGTLPNSVIVAITDGLDTAVPGALVTYDVSLKNRAPVLATEVHASVMLPSYMEFVDATEGGYWTGSNVQWKGLTVAPDGARTLRVTGRVRSDAPAGGTLRATAVVEGFESVDTTTIGTLVSGEGVSQTQRQMIVRKTADKSEVQPGSSVRYTIYVQNVTNTPLNNVIVEDRMNSQFAEILSTDNGTVLGKKIVWEIPTLQPGQEWIVHYNVQITENAPHGLTIANVVSVRGEGLETISLTERIYTSTIGVINTLPPTGVAIDGLFVLLSSLLGIVPVAMTRKGF